MKVCQNCGRRNPKFYTECPNCNFSLPEDRTTTQISDKNDYQWMQENVSQTLQNYYAPNNLQQVGFRCPFCNSTQARSYFDK
jgi:predicted ATP-dependent serine protease